MPTQAVPAAVYIGVEPPAKADASTRWISQSQRHLRVPTSMYSRTPLLGSAVGQSATQECSPWYNSALRRFECLVNNGSRQYFSYAPTPAGPWSTPVMVLGGGQGGEAAGVQQCTVHVENGVLYAFYITGNVTTLTMASAALPANPGDTPAFTRQGTVWTDTASSTGSPWVIKVGGLYWLFIERGGKILLATSAAANMAGLVGTPFGTVSTRSPGLTLNMGVRYNGGYGRPQVFNENGTWIMYVHMTGTVEFGIGQIRRFTCDDVDYPMNWVADTDGPLVRSTHPLEVDQVADFRAFQGDDDRWWACWAGNNNPLPAFSIFFAPMLEPIMAYDGAHWWPTAYQQDDLRVGDYIDPDIANTATATLSNQWDLVCDTSSQAITATVMRSASRMYFRVTNAPNNLIGNPLKLSFNSNDKVMGGNPITAMSASGTTVTVTTKRPHGLTTSDFVTITGAAPAAYNVANAAVASIVDANNFTYTAGSAPGANTTLGAYDTALQPGETRRYRCKVAGVWIRD